MSVLDKIYLKRENGVYHLQYLSIVWVMKDIQKAFEKIIELRKIVNNIEIDKKIDKK